MKAKTILVLATAAVMPFNVIARDTHSSDDDPVSDEVIAQQRQSLAENTEGKGFGPQSPRDIDSANGSNSIAFNAAPAYSQMNLCNIHFHKNAEHKGGEFTKYAGNGDSHGYLSGYQYSGHLTKAELSPLDYEVCPSEHGSLYPGDTIEVHYVYSTAQIDPGPELDSCFNDSIKNPQLRVEAQVYVLVNDKNAGDFGELTKHEKKNGFHQALSIPNDTGTPVQYAGSTTGPGYNEKGSPFQVTWSVRPKVAKVNIESAGKWCKGNDFKEDHAHGIRNVVVNPDLLSRITVTAANGDSGGETGEGPHGIPFTASNSGSGLGVKSNYEGQIYVHPERIDVAVAKGTIYRDDSGRGEIEVRGLKVQLAAAAPPDHYRAAGESNTYTIGKKMKPGDKHTIEEVLFSIPKKTGDIDLSKHWIVFYVGDPAGDWPAHSERDVFSHHSAPPERPAGSGSDTCKRAARESELSERLDAVAAGLCQDAESAEPIHCLERVWDHRQDWGVFREQIHQEDEQRVLALSLCRGSIDAGHTTECFLRIAHGDIYEEIHDEIAGGIPWHEFIRDINEICNDRQ